MKQEHKLRASGPYGVPRSHLHRAAGHLAADVLCARLRPGRRTGDERGHAGPVRGVGLAEGQIQVTFFECDADQDVAGRSGREQQVTQPESHNSAGTAPAVGYAMRPPGVVQYLIADSTGPG